MINPGTIKLFGVVKDGKKYYYRPSTAQDILDRLEGKQFVEILTERHEDTTNDQHGYYRAGIIRGTCMETELFAGWTEDEIHDYFANRYLTYFFEKEMAGKTVKVPGRYSTSEIGKKRMAEFIERVLHELAENGIYPMEPEAYYIGKYKTVKDVGQEKE